MRALLTVALVMVLGIGIAIAAETDSDAGAVRKGYNGFAGTVRGNIRLDGNALYVDQLGGPAVRILTDAIDEWRSLINGPATVKGDVILFGGQPVMIVSKAIPKKQHAGPATANFDVQGRIVSSPSGGVGIKTNDGFVRIANPEIVSQLRQMGEGSRAKVKGVLSVADGGFVLTANKAGEDKDSHVRSDGLTLGRNPVRGRAASISLATPPAQESGITLKKPAKRGKKRAGDIWDSHKSVITIGQPK